MNEPAQENIPDPAGIKRRDENNQTWGWDGSSGAVNNRPRLSNLLTSGDALSNASSYVQMVFLQLFPQQYLNDVILQETNKSLERQLTVGELLCRYFGIWLVLVKSCPGRMSHSVYWSNAFQQQLRAKKFESKFVHTQKLIFHQGKVVIPTSLIHPIITWFHHNLNHPGVTSRTFFETIHMHFNHHQHGGLHQKVKDHVSACSICKLLLMTSSHEKASSFAMQQQDRMQTKRAFFLVAAV